ncbi:hypothetical protein G3O06_25635 [Burkholderia sp. Ac-20345]|uniref:hypothetical protein n=1 Tax=Burkholderia sp. Ac-20345 TaxID=2703891 RepID=UPI00197BD9CA|nr:hypothetical protein [Burkholderia sp. Ac-20345]MBN3780898.1 hypothetical protein [Burkholderia sp. Ac-20345]
MNAWQAFDAEVIGASSPRLNRLSIEAWADCFEQRECCLKRSVGIMYVSPIITLLDV